jgi:hypothetical protein
VEAAQNPRDPFADFSKELLEMVRLDQNMREHADGISSGWDESVDSQNTERLKQFTDSYGWPTVPLVGLEASRAAGLIARHTPDIAFMLHCLELIEQVPPGEVEPNDVAYLTDRVLVLTGHAQIYGTQFHDNGEDIVPFPIEDAINLDRLRANVGLDSFEQGYRRVRGTDK